MKNYILSVLLFITVFSFSQTTAEEYNYLTKDLKAQSESGVHTKEGYLLEELNVIGKANYKFIFSAFIRSEKKEIAAISVIAKSDVSGKTYYYCIPLKNAKLTKQYESSLFELDAPMTAAYNAALSEMFAIISKLWLDDFIKDDKK